MGKIKHLLSLFLFSLFFALSPLSFAEVNEPGNNSPGAIEDYVISVFPNPIPKEGTFNITIVGYGFGAIDVHFIENNNKQLATMKYEINANNIKSNNTHAIIESYTQRPSAQANLAWSLTLYAKSSQFKAQTPHQIEVERDGETVAYATFIKNETSTSGVGTKPQPVCKLENGICREVNTSLGKIDPDPMKVVSTVLRYLMGLSGGLFLLIIIRAGYRMITSQGNPEQVKEARESLISAVTGFIFLLFAFIVLEIIGVDLFQLPGFNP